MVDRVVVFADYQNVYMSARESFHPPGATHWQGQIDPLALGRLIAERDVDRELAGVRVYRGLPDSTRDPRGYAASHRQKARWEQSETVHVITRTLRYPREWPEARPQEKGIDVSLALDFLLMAVRDEYDVGVLMSTDTDLKPALEAVAELGTARPEVAAWSTASHHSRRLSIATKRLWCHWLSDTDYLDIQDTRDYNRA